MHKEKFHRPVFIDRSDINRKLDRIKGDVVKWLDEKTLLEAEILAREGMYEHPDVDYWSED